MLLGALVATSACLYFTKGLVVKVSDGDTIVVHQGMGELQHIRLYGIDAPEFMQPGGIEATDYARDMMLYRRVSALEVDTDRYDRTVALVYLDDGRCANEEMIRAGHAWVYRKYCSRPFCKKLLTLEQQAREQKFGLWQDEGQEEPWRWRRLHPRQ